MDAQPSVNELAFASVGRTLRQSGQCSEGRGRERRRQHGQTRVVILSEGRVTVVTGCPELEFPKQFFMK